MIDEVLPQSVLPNAPPASVDQPPLSVPTSSLQLSNEFLPKVQAAFEKIYGTVKTRLGENNGQHIASFMQERLVDPLFLGSQKKVSDIEKYILSFSEEEKTEIRAHYAKDRPSLSIFRTFFFWRFLQKGLKVKGYVDVTNLRGANSVGEDVW